MCQKGELRCGRRYCVAFGFTNGVNGDRTLYMGTKYSVNVSGVIAIKIRDCFKMMDYFLGVIGAWLFSDGLYSILLY
uniref:Uncharacterized protein n=1 Tax=viral metagenome TaxID=1070528 RepID=A0A6M3J3X8_9ZZZZ